MFDVPVLEVTVPLPSTFVGNASQNKSLAIPHVSSALLDALETIPNSLRVVDSSSFDGVELSDESEVKTLLPQDGFRLLEPLNLAEFTVALENVLILSVNEPAQEPPVAAPELTKAVPVSAVAQAKPAAVAPVTPPAKASISATSPIILELVKQPAPLENVRDQLRNCVDDDVPQTTTQRRTSFQLLKQGVLVDELNDIEGPAALVDALEATLGSEAVNADSIRPIFDEAEPAIQLGEDILLKFMSRPQQAEIIQAEAASPQLDDSVNQWAAINWSDQLRQAMGAAALDPGDVQILLKGLQPSGQKVDGIASWYGPYFHGRLTANGETYDQYALTAAHKTLPFNTVLQVRNLKNNRTVIVRINDRGPYIGQRSLDLSRAAAQCLGSEKSGLIPYEATFLHQPSAVN